MEKGNKSLTEFQKMIIFFVIYSFMGWVCEEIFALFYVHGFIKRGFLFGPICPIYGYAAIILIVLFSNYKNKPIKLFVITAILFSIFEYVVDFFLQSMFAARWWDYTGQFLNLNGRITLSFSVVWGIGSIIFLKFIHPFVKKIVGKILKKMPTTFGKVIANTFILLIFVDTFMSSIHYLEIF